MPISSKLLKMKTLGNFTQNYVSFEFKISCRLTFLEAISKFDHFLVKKTKKETFFP
jgi:hypothetical protein